MDSDSRNDLLKPLRPLRPRLQGLYAFLGPAPERADARVREILDDLYERLAKDILVGFFFDGKDVKRIAEKQAEFILRAMGARAAYSGKSPASAHLSIAPILAGHFDRRVVVLRETLEAHGLPPEHVQTWIDFENAYRASIVS